MGVKKRNSKHHKACCQKQKEEMRLHRRKPPVTYCTNMTFDEKAKHKAHNVTSVEPEEYAAVMELNGVRSFIRRSAFHAQVCSINMTLYSTFKAPNVMQPGGNW